MTAPAKAACRHRRRQNNAHQSTRIRQIVARCNPEIGQREIEWCGQDQKPLGMGVALEAMPSPCGQWSDRHRPIRWLPTTLRVPAAASTAISTPSLSCRTETTRTGIRSWHAEMPAAVDCHFSKLVLLALDGEWKTCVVLQDAEIEFSDELAGGAIPGAKQWLDQAPDHLVGQAQIIEHLQSGGVRRGRARHVVDAA